jgi:hypothetical protein
VKNASDVRRKSQSHITRRLSICTSY